MSTDIYFLYLYLHSAITMQCLYNIIISIKTIQYLLDIIIMIHDIMLLMKYLNHYISKNLLGVSMLLISFLFSQTFWFKKVQYQNSKNLNMYRHRFILLKGDSKDK